MVLKMIVNWSLLRFYCIVVPRHEREGGQRMKDVRKRREKERLFYIEREMLLLAEE
jgi:hypothetical protein